MDDPIGSWLILQLVLILANAFFAAAEAAIASVNENHIRKRADEGDAAAIRLLGVMETPASFLSAIQVCITLSGFLASAFAADHFAPLLAKTPLTAGFAWLDAKALHTLCLLFITLLLSFFTIVLGELVPKRIAMKHAEKVACAVGGVIVVVSKPFLPLVWLLTASTNAVLRLFGINPNESAEEVTEEEIRMMVDIGSESGAIEQDERTMIENIFEFNNTTAADIMLHRMDVVALPINATNDEILSTIRKSGLSRFPVYGEDIDDVVGILTTRLFLLNLQNQHPKPLSDLLRKPYLVPETVPADTLFSNMQKQKVHMAIVVDEYGGMSGIVTMEDLLEEIVGNIYDEFDPSEDVEIDQLEESLWRVTGTVALDTLAEALEINLPLDEEYDTLGSMIFSTFSRIPEDGETPEVTIHGLHVQVESISDHRIEKALVKKVSSTLSNAANEEDAD